MNQKPAFFLLVLQNKKILKNARAFLDDFPYIWTKEIIKENQNKGY